MIEKINKILEKLPPEYREPVRTAFEILIQEQIKVWNAIEHLTYAIDNMRRSNEGEFNRIWEIINQLTKVIEEGNKRIDRLEKAIEESNKRIDRLEEAIENMRKSNEEQFNRVWNAIEEMRRSNEEEFKRIWNAIEEMRKSNEEEFRRVWSSIQELKNAMKETNERIDKLVSAFERSEKLNKETRKKLEALSDNFGYLLEDRAIRYLPKLLKDKFNAEVIEPIKRTYLKVNGSYIEVNIYGKIKIGDEEFILIGETKTRLSKKEIEKFISKCNRIGGKQFRILISYILEPQFEEIILNNNIKFINSYEIEI